MAEQKNTPKPKRKPRPKPPARDERKIEVGDRFQTRDTRDDGRVIRITEIAVDVLGETNPDFPTGREYLAETVVHPDNPDAVGNVSRLSEETIRDRYFRISR